MAIRRAVHRRVVEDHHLSVGRELHVELHEQGADLEGASKRREGVFRAVGRVAPVRDDERGHCSGRSARGLLPKRAFEDARLQEDVEQGLVELPVGGLVLQDVDGAFHRHGLLVRPVPGHEGVEDVGDGHHPRLDRDLRRRETARIARAVELLVVGVGDVGDAAVLTGPGNLRQESVGVSDVALDLPSLALREAATAYGKRGHLAAVTGTAGRCRRGRRRCGKEARGAP